MEPGALSGVRVPILMLTGEKDPHTPPIHAEIVKRGVADPAMVEHRVIANAGHFSFLTPFPEAMTNPAFPPSQDPEGFDRARFHQEMNAEVLEFLNRTVKPLRSNARTYFRWIPLDNPPSQNGKLGAMLTN
jgi:predicted dienelactone hydrolase